MNNGKHLSLLQLNQQVQQSIAKAFAHSVWITAEISELSVNRNGHCYMELVELENESKKVVARARATIWAYSFRMIRPYFEQSTKQRFAAGIKVLVEASVEYHEIYGFSLNIKDIDPTYTLGDMALKRKNIIEQLKNTGVFNMNHHLELPLVAQRIAIISSPTAAGLQDFLNQLENNSEQIKFYTKLFPAIMQGEKTSSSVISAMDAVSVYADEFDLLVIIRGGGAQLDLASFDDYNLANNVAQFPLPILTGIGHDKDETIVDLVAHRSLKTPTAVAEFIINEASNFKNYLSQLSLAIKELSSDVIQQQVELLANCNRELRKSVLERVVSEKHKLSVDEIKIKSASNRLISIHENRLTNRAKSIESKLLILFSSKHNQLNLSKSLIKKAYPKLIQQELTKLEYSKLRIQLSNPKHILKRGYAILYKDGKAIKTTSKLNEGDTVVTQLYNGKIESIITKNNHGKKEN